MGYATWIFVYASLSTSYIVISCAGTRSVDATTFGGSTPSVTSWWAGAQTAKEERREEGKWFFEKNKRVVLLKTARRNR